MIFSENLFQEILTLKHYFDTYFQYVLCLVLFLNRKGKIFSKQDHSHFYSSLNPTSFCGRRFHLNLFKSKNGSFCKNRAVKMVVFAQAFLPSCAIFRCKLICVRNISPKSTGI